MSDNVWLKFPKWRTTYGPVVYLRMFHQHVIVINTLQAAIDLPEKRATIYSSRPRFEVACQMLTEGYSFTFQAYGDLWRRMRRAAHESLHKGVVHQLHNIQTVEAALLLHSLLDAPKDWEDHMKRAAGSTLLSACYGTPLLRGSDDPTMEILDTFTSKIVRAGYIDGTYVEYLPFLKHIPARLAPWKNEALVWGPRFTKLFGDLFTWARDRAINGESPETISAMMIENQVRYNLSVQEAGWLVGTVGINRDQAIWGPDADDFNPERYMDVRGGKLSSVMTDTKEEGHVSFGFGRRICVGRHVAHDSLLLNMASILWMFDIKAPLDALGQEVACGEESVDHGLAV
ncbi:cytochrome P450 [Cubamyces sp. BRFM 1775]|nr:cytochrome P450 [Cubamyces sp. BRFM 1775]